MKNDALIEEFLKDIRLRGWSEWTIKTCRFSMDLLKESIGKKSLKDVGMDELREFLFYLKGRPGRSGNVSSETLRKHINNLSSFFEFLEDEEYILKSPVPHFRRKYLRNSFKEANKGQIRQIIDLPQMRKLLGSILDPQDKSMFVLLAKTGLRAHELVSLDVDNISLENLTAVLKSTGKRKRMVIFFDYETKGLLVRWLNLRKEIALKNEKALFVTNEGRRMSQTIMNKRLKKYAERLGLHDPQSQLLERRFTSHCFRHFFTTELINSGMSREYVKELRGDSRSETIDIYYHINPEELKKEYLIHIPKFNL